MTSDTQIVLCVLPRREQQSVVLQATRTKVIAGLLHQHRPGLRSFHGVAAKDSHQPDRYFHAAVVAPRAMGKLFGMHYVAC